MNPNPPDTRAATTVSVHTHTAFEIGEIDPRLLGGFIEHMGRAIYTGIYEPGHPSADGEGWRLDVIEAIKNLGVSTVRYPGGNFVSSYRWEDGIGPLEDRPRRVDLAWRSIESNRIGVDEFMRWCALAGVQPMMCVNLGTRGIEDAANLVEYCNHPSGTEYSDLRQKYASEKPYGIRLWCLGNEVDGPWQIGAKSAREYGALAREAAKAMRAIDDTIECIACGSSGPRMPTHPRWEAEVALEAYEAIDYIAIHVYYERGGRDPEAFLAQSDDFGKYIIDTLAAVDYARACKRSDKVIHLAVDEWNVWNDKSDLTDKSKMGVEAPALLEEIYDHLDALLVGALLIQLLNHCDRVKIACLAQLVNVLAPIQTTAGGGITLQSIYYPFADVARHARQTVLRTSLSGDRAGALAIAATVDKDRHSVTYFVVNKSAKEPVTLELAPAGFPGASRVAILSRTDMLAQAESEFLPVADLDPILLQPLSWNIIRLEFAP